MCLQYKTLVSDIRERCVRFAEQSVKTEKKH